MLTARYWMIVSFGACFKCLWSSDRFLLLSLSLVSLKVFQFSFKVFMKQITHRCISNALLRLVFASSCITFSHSAFRRVLFANFIPALYSYRNNLLTNSVDLCLVYSGKAEVCSGYELQWNSHLIKFDWSARIIVFTDMFLVFIVISCLCFIWIAYVHMYLVDLAN